MQANHKTRPKPTLFPGSVIFCREQQRTHGHLYRVLLGERKSPQLVRAYATWLAERGLPWPKAAKVKPAA